jgi:hypothetical protein
MPKTLPTMANANKCPTCRKHFASDKALQQHTGATNQKGRKKHRCGKCDETFYSEQAMEQHRESPIHDAILSNTMLECAPCDRWFGSKTALTQHERSGLHAKVVAEKAQHEEPEVKEEDRDENEDEDVEENKEEEGDEADWEDIEDEDSETSGDPDDSDDTVSTHPVGLTPCRLLTTRTEYPSSRVQRWRVQRTLPAGPCYRRLRQRLRLPAWFLANA